MQQTRKIKRQNRRGPKTTVSRSLTSPVPDRFLTTLNYADNILQTTTTAPASYMFVLNDIYDPNYTGTGHQPLGRDQWALFYSQYRVLSVDIDITMSNTTSYSVLAGYMLKTDISVTTDMNTAIEKPYSKILVVPPIDTASSNNVLRIRGLRPNKILGLTDAEYRGEQNYSAVMSASPAARAPILHLISQCADLLTSVSVRFIVEISYHVELFSRVPLVGS